MVLLVTPNTKLTNYGLTTSEFSAIQPNIYMNILQSVYVNVKKIPCKAIHMEGDRVTTASLLKYISCMKPDKVGIISSGSNPSASTMTMPGAIELVKAIKTAFPRQYVFLWGGHPSVLPTRTKKESGVDSVVVGTDFDCDVTKIPMIDWKDIDPTKYRAHNWHCFGNLSARTPYAVIWTSLGCPYTCSFCCVNNIFGKRTYKLRNMSDVVSEIDYLVRKHNVKNIKIMDELFVSRNHSRIYEFCTQLIKRKYDLNMWCFARVDTVNPQILEALKKAGVNWIAYGFESLSQSSLDSHQKQVKAKDYHKVISWTRQAGMNIIADFVVGFHDDTLQTMQDTYDFMCHHNFEFINLYPLFAYPGTPLYDQYIEQGIISEPVSWSEYSLYGVDCKPCPTKTLTSSDVLHWRDERYVEYFRRPEYLHRIQKKFGIETRQHVERMAQQKLER